CFDAENRLTKVVQGSQTLASYKYDGLGRRIEKVENGTTVTRYVYDRQDILEVYTGSSGAPALGFPSLRFTHDLGIDKPLVLDRATNPSSGVFDQSFFYLTDHLGSVVKMVDANGNEVQSYVYDSFGNIVQQNPSPPAINQPFTYTGREWDGITGLYYY